VLSSRAINTAGQAITPQHPGCIIGLPARACANSLRSIVTYQPATHYWPFQAYETAIFLALILAALLPRARAVLPPPKSNENPPAVLVAAWGCRDCVALTDPRWPPIIEHD
jgi:hypothetical protein